MSEKVEECDECGRVYDIFVNRRCPTCSTVAERTADNGYTVTTDSEDGPSAGS
jgi:RNA polymerase subunit RPABC4/transcription elongation factor Spt4